ncbi:winged helix-turn-helix domain-containing protein [Rhizobium ruizarguesonis]|uniref:winged helix-turn-helix domain-containing protein n=1 Tax=Rhizobium ruizarguesonis TaxID=2081791 RepID=UPI0013CFC3E0|nr:winged helix-turn-helix domain-containing protein [Rhizobium ruizarguesonis]NEH80570.1 winged helix-turn-helix domain-containing protein [Rhizobium ruizarguesonis]NEI75493.1 winged helix-turn-helix domain-containing protein [Rhizobium ruizarguesonis]
MARSDTLFVTDGELSRRLGLTLDQLKIALPGATKAGFPVPDPLFANRRYWPACVAWLDRRYGLGAQGLPGLDGVERWKAT